MTQFSLDSKARHLQFALELKGESEPLVGEVRYDLRQENAALYVKLTEIKLSKEWLHLAAQDALLGKEFSLEDKRVETLLKLLNIV
ncbi:MAG: hypothetical protein ACRCYY_10715 [Trueperaceae bacterium]